mmetsp:Transcript_119465/g.372186  ORF Transcript_119465/g.372186 Transcript_119465/m.372186 type:complete len:236 (+) Transcript_119465:745-1452(+)
MASSLSTAWNVLTQVGDAGSSCNHSAVRGSAPRLRRSVAWPTSWGARPVAGRWTPQRAWTSRRASGSLSRPCMRGGTGLQQLPRTGECTLPVAAMDLGRQGCAALSVSTQRQGRGAFSRHCRFRGGVQQQCLPVAACAFWAEGTAAAPSPRRSASTRPQARGSRCHPCRLRGSSVGLPHAGAERRSCAPLDRLHDWPPSPCLGALELGEQGALSVSAAIFQEGPLRWDKMEMQMP